MEKGKLLVKCPLGKCYNRICLSVFTQTFVNISMLRVNAIKTFAPEIKATTEIVLLADKNFVLRLLFSKNITPNYTFLKIRNEFRA